MSTTPPSTPAAKRALLLLTVAGMLVLSSSTARADIKPAGTKYPFSAIVQIKAMHVDKPKKGTDTIHSGSGVLIGPYHVLTCGHVLYDDALGGYVSKVEVFPMAKGKERPFGSAVGTKSRVFSQWMEFNKKKPGGVTNGTAHDVGLITLDQPIGDRTGFFPFAPAKDESFVKGTVFNMAGYPFEEKYDGQQMYVDAGPIEGLAPGGLSFSYKRSAIANFTGMSGGPAWMYDTNSKRRIVHGVNIGKYKDGSGFAARITPSIYKQLQDWRKADPAPAPRPAVAQPKTSPPGTLSHALQFSERILSARRHV